MVRDSYLPTNKLKDAPPASQYEGTWHREAVPADAELVESLLPAQLNCPYIFCKT